MSEWKEYKLDEIIERFIDYRGKTPRKVISGIPLITAKVVKNGRLMPSNEFIAEEDYHSWMTRGFPEKNDIVLTTEAPLGEVALIKDKNVALAQRIITLRGKERVVDNIFLKYYLQSPRGQNELQSRASGTTVMGIKAELLKKIPVFIPPIEEQKRIAGVLSSLDDKIDLLNRENATLEALAETLFRHYFIENPDSTWKEGKLGDYVIETIGGEWGTEVPEGESNMPVRCLRGADVADLNDGIATRTPLRYIKPSKYEKIKPNNGDIILEISGGTDTCSTGRVAYINEGVKQLFDYPIVFSNFCRLLRVDERHTFFVYCFFRYLHKQGEFFNLENGSSGIHNLNYKAALYEMDWNVPTDEKVVIDFNNQVKPYFDKINANKQQILALSAQRDALLPQLMSGEVDVDR